MKSKWVCPRCTAGLNEHGKGKCRSSEPAHCDGLLCHCDSPKVSQASHGETLLNVCSDARCDHCDWTGAMPVRTAFVANN